MRRTITLTAVVLGASLLAGCPAVQGPTYETTGQLAVIPMPDRALGLAWSADGAYLATGSNWIDPGNGVYVVDVARGSVAASHKVTGAVDALAFSPDGKWLAAGTAQSMNEGPGAAQLLVFDVPAFTVKFTARAGGQENSFTRVAWAADGKTLFAIDDESKLPGDRPAAVRRWTVPDFAEQPAVKAPQTGTYSACVASPDGRTLAVADVTSPQYPETEPKLTVRLMDLAGGVERASFEAKAPSPWMAFTPDGKAVGVVVGKPNQTSWWDANTGKPVDLNPPRFARQPADSAHPVSPDGRVQAVGRTVHGRLVGEEWGQPPNNYGEFINVTDNSTGTTTTWRVGDGNDGPPVAFSPDGTRMAASVYRDGDPNKPGSGGGFIVIWSTPK